MTCQEEFWITFCILSVPVTIYQLQFWQCTTISSPGYSFVADLNLLMIQSGFDKQMDCDRLIRRKMTISIRSLQQIQQESKFEPKVKVGIPSRKRTTTEQDWLFEKTNQQDTNRARWIRLNVVQVVLSDLFCPTCNFENKTSTMYVRVDCCC